jgi:transposase, IS30 family
MGKREPLRFEEREIISRELSRTPECPTRFIGKLLGRHHSTIAREIDRNGGAKGYRAVDAQARAEALLPRPKPRKLETSQRLHDAVNDGLAQKWSPKQISSRLRADHPDDPPAARGCIPYWATVIGWSQLSSRTRQPGSQRFGWQVP